MNPADYIDPDEGRDVQPFFAEAQPCQSCGRPCDELEPAEWHPGLMVGSCCRWHWDDLPYWPLCDDFPALLESCKTVPQVARVMRLHLATCRKCAGGTEAEEPKQERKAA